MKPKQLLIVLGMPGAGKDTQIARLQARRPLEVLRTGDMVRIRAKNDPDLAKVLEAGDLVSDEVVNDLVIDSLQGSGEDLLISDGFPRDMTQAKWLEAMLPKHGYSLQSVLYLHISDAEALGRLIKRGRSDDDQATVKHRIQVFHTETDPVIEYFKTRGKLTEINGEQTIESVAADIEKVLGW